SLRRRGRREGEARAAARGGRCVPPQAEAELDQGARKGRGGAAARPRERTRGRGSGKPGGFPYERAWCPLRPAAPQASGPDGKEAERWRRPESLARFGYLPGRRRRPRQVHRPERSEERRVGKEW